ncbi:MAG: hypothetical protein O3A00_22915, partial [Planctomycetota bacterium]|nr:hypothetical protein [Planctomycetota bacterium]
FAILVTTLLVPCSRTAHAADTKFVDHSLLVAPEYPCTWPSGFPAFQINHFKTIGPDSPYNIDVLTIDGNTGTQLDVPPHSVARPELKLPNSGKFGHAFTHVIEPWVSAMWCYSTAGIRSHALHARRKNRVGELFSDRKLRA